MSIGLLNRDACAMLHMTRRTGSSVACSLSLEVVFLQENTCRARRSEAYESGLSSVAAEIGKFRGRVLLAMGREKAPLPVMVMAL